jgi:hypothetical protein
MQRGRVWKPLRERGGWMHLSERAVFLALLERADNEDCSIPPYVTPSLVQLAEMAGCSKSAAALALGHLEWHGWVERKRSKGGRSRKTAYQLREGFPCGPECDQRRPLSPRAGRQSSPPPKRSGDRTVYDGKQSGERTPKQSNSHSQTRRPARVSDEGLREGEGRQGSVAQPAVRSVAGASSAGDSANGQRKACAVCQLPMDPALVAAGYSTHPCCDPYEVSPLWPVTDISR